MRLADCGRLTNGVVSVVFFAMGCLASEEDISELYELGLAHYVDAEDDGRFRLRSQPAKPFNVEIFVNGIPVCVAEEATGIVSQGLNSWLKPGENLIEFRGEASSELAIYLFGRKRTDSDSKVLSRLQVANGAESSKPARIDGSFILHSKNRFVPPIYQEGLELPQGWKKDLKAAVKDYFDALNTRDPVVWEEVFGFSMRTVLSANGKSDREIASSIRATKSLVERSPDKSASAPDSSSLDFRRYGNVVGVSSRTKKSAYLLSGKGSSTIPMQLFAHINGRWVLYSAVNYLSRVEKK